MVQVATILKSRKAKDHDTFIPLDYRVIKIGWNPSIVELSYDQSGLKSSRDR